ncbi:MAG: hypothetical protein HY344_00380 [Candidatus Levybacteria bacterium]|nr:hypothetical protein [Candidatus Levybacteria bacterium]
MEETSNQGDVKEEIIAQQNQENFKSKIKVSKKLLFALGILTVFIVSGSIWVLNFSKNVSIPAAENDVDNDTSVKTSQQPTLPRQWSDCDDVRDVIEEENTIYVACLGGVLILDKKGNVKDTLTMAQGLNSQTVTSLEKEGDILYIGGQKGFNIFDLKEKNIRGFTSDNGLISNSNIELALDRNYLWVGTFEGLNRYDTKTGEMKSYQGALGNNSVKDNISNLLVTPNAVYAIILAGDLNPGGVVRFDKKTEVWEYFGPKSFPVDSSEKYNQDRSRIDLYGLALAGNHVLVGYSQKVFWQIEDKKDGSWISVPGSSQITGQDSDSSLYLISGKSDKAYLVLNDSVAQIFSYNPDSKQIAKVNLGNSNFLKDVGTGMFGYFNVSNKLWFYSRTDSFLKWVDLKTLGKGEITLQNRPKNFNLIASVNGNAILVNKDIWQFKEGKFEKLKTISLNNFLQDSSISPTFQPIYNTSKIFIMTQSCGMGCSKPEAVVLDYKTGEAKTINVSSILNVKSEFGYGGFRFDKYDFKEKKLIFSFEDYDKQLIVNTTDFSLEEKELNQQSVTPLTNIETICNLAFEFKNDVFVEKSCLEKVENNEFEWELVSGQNTRLIQINKQTKQSSEIQVIDPNATPNIEESPFSLYSIRFIDDGLWISTNKGLVKYNPQNQGWKIVTVKNGLVSNDINNFIINGDRMWVDTGWGGLSNIPLP